MKIAFTHNLQVVAGEEEAEFDSPATVTAITSALRRLGHEVDPVEVSGPTSSLVARLEGLRPDLVFNTAEGRSSRTREAFFPALFEQLGIPHTGSEAFACTVSLDKRLTKLLAQRAGVPTPRWDYVESVDAPVDATLRYPLIVKPNFEGSSKGITEASIVHNEGSLREQIKELTRRFGSGVLIEEYVEGTDVAVPFLEAISPETGGVLTPATFKLTGDAGRRSPIYDFHLKNEAHELVEVRAPAELPDALLEELRRRAGLVFKTVGIRDFGRCDFRVTASGEVMFIEVNALPGLDPGAAIFASGALAGATNMEAVLDAILRSAVLRQGLVERGQDRAEPVRVGLVYNLKRVVPTRDGQDDQHAEFDSEYTISAIHRAIEKQGHQVVRLEATAELLTRIQGLDLDVVFNIAEGTRGRAREALVPAILELLDIPYTGSDAATLAVTLDKALAKRIVREAGVATPDFFVMNTGRERIPAGFAFPLICKPVAEGSSKGVMPTSVVRDEAELRQTALGVIKRYDQGALVEAFLPGREFTIGLLGNDKGLRTLPPMEIVFQGGKEHPIYTFEHKQAESKEVRYQAPAEVSPALGKALKKVAREAFEALGCRDVARIDLRLDAQGRPNFIECNPLPGLTPEWSDLCLVAKAAGMDHTAVVAEILAPALARMRSQRKQLKRL